MNNRTDRAKTSSGHLAHCLFRLMSGLAVAAASACAPAAAIPPSPGPPMEARIPVESPPPRPALRCVAPLVKRHQQAYDDAIGELRDDGHPAVEIRHLFLVGQRYALAEVRLGPDQPWAPKQLVPIMHPNPEVRARWSPQPPDADAIRLHQVAEAMRQRTPRGLRLVQLETGMNHPDRVVVVPVYSEANGATGNVYRLVYQLFEREGVKWVTKGDLAEERRRSDLGRQRALARHLNAHHSVLLNGQGAKRRDPRGALLETERFDCRAPTAETARAWTLVLVHGDEADPGRWRMSEISVTPDAHQRLIEDAQRDALKALVGARGLSVVFHDEQQRLMIHRRTNGGLITLRYSFKPDGDTPARPKGWRITLHPLPDVNEHRTVYEVLLAYFGGAKVRAWRSFDKMERLIVLDGCPHAAPGCTPRYATTVALGIDLQEGPNRWKRGRLQLLRAANSDPFDASSWTVDAVALERVPSPPSP